MKKGLVLLIMIGLQWIFPPDMPAGPLDYVRVQGDRLVAGPGGDSIHLKGVNFSFDRLAPRDGSDWFIGTCRKLAAEHTAVPVTNWYQEKHLHLAASLGFNTIRMNLHYRIFEDDGRPGFYKESAWDFLDHYVAWAKRNDLYLILDMHVPQGGLQPSGGGGACLWENRLNRERFVKLWEAIAKRYRDEPVIAAYDLLNEPTPSRAPGQWAELARRTAKAIRSVDREHLIIIERVNWLADVYGNSPRSNWDSHVLESFQVSIDDNNVMYDFHFYDPQTYTLQNENNRADEGNYPNLQKHEVAKDGTDWQRDRQYLSHEMDLETRSGSPMFIGEFGAHASTYNREKGGLTYIRDVIELMEEKGLNWSYYYMNNLYEIDCCEAEVPCCAGDNPTRPNEALTQVFRETLR